MAAIGFGRPSWTVFYAPQAEQLPGPGVVFRPLRNPTPVMRTFLAVRPTPPGAGLRALIEACHAPSSGVLDVVDRVQAVERGDGLVEGEAGFGHDRMRGGPHVIS